MDPPETVDRICAGIRAWSSAHSKPACVRAARYPPPDKVSAIKGPFQSVRVAARLSRATFLAAASGKAERTLVRALCSPESAIQLTVREQTSISPTRSVVRPAFLSTARRQNSSKPYPTTTTHKPAEIDNDFTVSHTSTVGKNNWMIVWTAQAIFCAILLLKLNGVCKAGVTPL